jgi:hypothetical protein
MSTSKTRVLDLSRSTDRTFVQLLVNTLLVSVINFTVWFAITFWVFLETKSVLATGMVRHLLGDHGRQRDLVRQPRRSLPEEDRDAGLGGGLGDFLRHGVHAVSADGRADLHQSSQRLVVGLHRLGDVRGDHGQYPVDRAADTGDGLDS